MVVRAKEENKADKGSWKVYVVKRCTNMHRESRECLTKGVTYG